MGGGGVVDDLSFCREGKKPFKPGPFTRSTRFNPRYKRNASRAIVEGSERCYNITTRCTLSGRVRSPFLSPKESPSIMSYRINYLINDEIKKGKKIAGGMKKRFDGVAEQRLVDGSGTGRPPSSRHAALEALNFRRYRRDGRRASYLHGRRDAEINAKNEEGEKMTLKFPRADKAHSLLFGLKTCRFVRVIFKCLFRLSK